MAVTDLRREKTKVKKTKKKNSIEKSEGTKEKHGKSHKSKLGGKEENRKTKSGKIKKKKPNKEKVSKVLEPSTTSSTETPQNDTQLKKKVKKSKSKKKLDKGKKSATKLAPNEEFNAHWTEFLLTQAMSVTSLPSENLATDKTKLSTNGSPLVIFLAASGLRCMELKRSLSVLGLKRTAKLFAKHMKTEEQKKFMDSHVVEVAYGTPSRVRQLVDSGHLKLEHLHAMVIDWTYQDVKERRLCHFTELRDETMRLIHSTLHLFQRKNFSLVLL